MEVTEPEDMDINNFGDFDIGDSRTYNVKLKNKGTVTVYDVSYSVPTLTGDYKWDMPTQFNNLTLQPDETIDSAPIASNIFFSSSELSPI